MKTKLLFSAMTFLLLSLSISPIAFSNTTSSGQNTLNNMASKSPLAKAATGYRFAIGTVEYQMVPRAAVQKTAAANVQNSDKSWYIKPYLITLDAGGSGASSDKLAVAINWQTEKPVVVTSKLNVYCNQPDRAAALARMGQADSYETFPPSSKITFEYSSPEKALSHIDLLKKQACVKGVEPQIIDSVMRLR